MRGAVRLLGVPMLVAAVAFGIAHAKPSHPKAAHPKLPRAGAAHAKPAHGSPTWHSPTIVGEWTFGNGLFVFHRNRARNAETYTDTVVLQRPSVFCPNVNDQDGQVVLHHQPRSRVYTGTWQWFYTSNCKFAGYGPVTITVWWANQKATFVSAPPPGLHGPTNIFMLYRVK